MFIWTFGGTFTGGLLRLHFLWSENFFEVIDFKTIKHVSKITDSDPFFFITLTSVFPQHCVNCIINVQKNIWKDFFLWKQQELFVNSGFSITDFEPFLGKISCQISKVALGATIVTFWAKTSFLKKYLLFRELSDIEQKISRFLAKNSDRKGNLLWSECVKGSTSKKDCSLKTIINFVNFFRRRTKTNWVFRGSGLILIFFRFIFFGLWAENQLTLAKTF